MRTLAYSAMAFGVLAAPAIAADVTLSYADPGVVRCQVCGAPVSGEDDGGEG
jgi:hypothetical protein